MAMERFALVQARPVQALSLFRHRPAPIVQSTSNRVKAYDIRSQLRQGHAPQRRSDKGGAFYDTQVFQQVIHTPCQVGIKPISNCR